jgi:hypothetical protein
VSNWRAADKFAWHIEEDARPNTSGEGAPGSIDRTVFTVAPPKVEYSLTPLGATFAEPIEVLYRWGEENTEALDELQARKSVPAGGG